MSWPARLSPCSLLSRLNGGLIVWSSLLAGPDGRESERGRLLEVYGLGPTLHAELVFQDSERALSSDAPMAKGLRQEIPKRGSTES